MNSENSLKLKYRPAIVTYIDLLGFSQLIKDTDNADVTRIKEVVDRFQTAANIEFIKTYEDLYEGEVLFETAFFSDSVARITYLDHLILSEHPYGSVFNEVLALAYTSIDLLPYGILPRGGITAGYVYVDQTKNQLFGPAMVEAVELEKKIGSPCIAIHSDVLEIAPLPPIKSRNNSASEELEYIKPFLKQDANGLYFIDPFGAAFSELGYEVFDWFKKVMELIVVSLQKYKDDERVIGKYEWLKERYNEAIGNLNSEAVMHEFGIDKDALFIA